MPTAVSQSIDRGSVSVSGYGTNTLFSLSPVQAWWSVSVVEGVPSTTIQNDVSKVL